MKLPLAILAMTCISQVIMAQGTLTATGDVVVQNAARKPTYLQELFRDPVKPAQHAGINGSPFLCDNWLLARLQFADGRVADSVLIRINAYDNKVHFLDENNQELEATVPMKEILIIDNNLIWHGKLYRSGYAGDPKAFFQVVQDGKKMQLLKKVMLNIWQAKAMGEEDKRSFQYEQELYFATGNTLYKQNKKCSAIAEAFGEKKEKVEQYISANDIKCIKEEDMMKVVVYYNSLW